MAEQEIVHSTGVIPCLYSNRLAVVDNVRLRCSLWEVAKLAPWVTPWFVNELNANLSLIRERAGLHSTSDSFPDSISAYIGCIRS